MRGTVVLRRREGRTLQGVKTVTRRVIGGIVGCVVIAPTLSGCLFAYDAAKTHVHHTNSSSEDVLVIIEGENVKFPRQVASQSSYPEVLDECQGAGIRVEAESGQLIGRVDAQACPDWTLTINDDGSLDYVEDD